MGIYRRIQLACLEDRMGIMQDIRLKMAVGMAFHIGH